MRSPGRNIASVVAVLLSGSALQASAANWEFDPRIELSAIYDDNYRLTDNPGTEIEVAGGGVDAELEWRTQSQRSLFAVAPRIRATRFPGESSENSTDYFLRLDGEQHTQRVRSAIHAQYAEESVVTSELLVADFPGIELGQPVGGDGGRVSVRNRRQLILLNPSAYFEWTERRRIELQASYLDATYDENLFEQVGYQDVRGIAGVEFDVSQRSTVAVRGLLEQYSPDANLADSTSTGFQVEVRTRQNETMRYYVRGGLTRTERDANGITQPAVSDTGLTAGAGVSWNYQVTTVVLDAIRSQEPSSAGVVVNRDEIRFRFNRDLQPRLSAFIGVRGVRTEGAIEEFANVRDRKYLTGTTGFAWRLSRQYTLQGAYDYAWQEFESEPADATSNALNLSLIYEPRRLN